MQLSYLCDMELTYEGGFRLVRPYGGQEGTGFGQGRGVVRGDRLHGTLQWVNQPHRRSDSAMLPDVHGLILTEDGAEIMFSLQGRTVWRPDGSGGQLLTALFEAEDERYRWLNTSLCVLEGVIVMPTMQARVYECVHELTPATP